MTRTVLPNTPRRRWFRGNGSHSVVSPDSAVTEIWSRTCTWSVRIGMERALPELPRRCATWDRPDGGAWAPWGTGR